MKILLCILVLSGLCVSVIQIQPSYGQLSSCHCVAFRLDDIQDYKYNNAAIAIMDLFEMRNASLTIAVIGGHIGNDTRLIDHIKEIIINSPANNFSFDIANHGWHFPEKNFTNFNVGEQSLLIRETNKKISSIFGITPQVFIAPNSVFNKNTLIAARNNGLLYFSASRSNDPPPYHFQNVTLPYHFPETAATGDVEPNGTNWFSIPHQQIFADILSSLDKYGFAEVVMHPQDHSIRQGSDIENKVDWQQIKELDSLIDQVKNQGLKIVTIKEIKQNMDGGATNNSTNDNSTSP